MSHEPPPSGCIIAFVQLLALVFAVAVIVVFMDECPAAHHSELE